MKIAYLITAYDQPEHLGRLVDTLDGPHADFFVHVDRRVDIEPFRRALPPRENIQFVANRVTVNWMGFTQVESILELLRCAHRKGFDYCVLLSGSDYPIKSNSQIVKFYTEAKTEFIVFWLLEDRPSWQHKTAYFYPIDLVPIYRYFRNTEPAYWRRFFWGRFFKYRHMMPRRKPLNDMKPYGGSDWWSLSFICVDYVLRYVDENPAYVRHYRYTHCPSEMFFQTIILNSDLKARVQNYQLYAKWSATTAADAKRREDAMLPEDSFNFRYIEWSKGRTDGSGSPAVLDERDWPKLVASADLFARKFHPRLSSRVLDQIDNDLLGCN